MKPSKTSVGAPVRVPEDMTVHVGVYALPFEEPLTPDAAKPAARYLQLVSEKNCNSAIVQPYVTGLKFVTRHPVLLRENAPSPIGTEGDAQSPKHRCVVSSSEDNESFFLSREAAFSELDNKPKASWAPLPPRPLDAAHAAAEQKRGIVIETSSSKRNNLDL